jgi:hypothetical protein
VLSAFVYLTPLKKNVEREMKNMPGKDEKQGAKKQTVSLSFKFSYPM